MPYHIHNTPRGTHAPPVSIPYLYRDLGICVPYFVVPPPNGAARPNTLGREERRSKPQMK